MTSTMRLTIAIAVIMVEISDDVHMLLPVLVAIMVAKWVADAATHSIYHALLEVKCVPFLVHEPVSRFSLELLPVSAVMRSPVVCLELLMKVRGGFVRGVSIPGWGPRSLQEAGTLPTLGTALPPHAGPLTSAVAAPPRPPSRSPRCLTCRASCVTPITTASLWCATALWARYAWG
jgi:hypothetical protein